MKKRKNFTLIEILVVVGIIELLVGVGLPTYYSHMKAARIKTAQAQIAQFVAAVVSFEMDMKRLPDANVGLSELLENSSGSTKWKGPYLELEEIPLDPWDNEYVYQIENGRYLIISYGADGQAGGEGDNADITNRGIKKK